MARDENGGNRKSEKLHSDTPDLFDILVDVPDLLRGLDEETVQALLGDLPDGAENDMKELLRDPADEGRLITDAFAAGVAPPYLPPLVHWASENRICTADRADGVYWSPSQTPYFCPIMEAQHPDSPIRKTTLNCAVQLGKSEILWNIIFWYVTMTRERVLVVFPARMSSAGPFLQLRVDEDIEAMERHGVFKTTIMGSSNRRSSRYFRYFWDPKTNLPLGRFSVGFAGTRKSISSGTFPIVIMDEVDDFVAEKQGENQAGPPDLEAEGRTEAVKYRRKIVKASSPKNAQGRSVIERDYNAAALQLKFEVNCPKCNHAFNWSFDDLSFNRAARLETEIGDVFYLCPKCRFQIEDFHRNEMNAAGRLVDQHGRPFDAMNPADGATSIGLHLNGLSSPPERRSHRDVAKDYVRMVRQDNPRERKLFFNLILAETVGEDIDELTAAEVETRVKEIKKKPNEYYMGNIPPGYEFLVCGCDLAGDRIDYVILGANSRYRVALIEAGTIEGSPLKPDLYSALEDRTIWRDFPRAVGNGPRVGMWAEALDAQGQYGNTAWRPWVLDYALRLRNSGFKRVFPVAGASYRQDTVTLKKSVVHDEIKYYDNGDVDVMKGVYKRPMWYLDTVYLTDEIYGNFRVKDDDDVPRILLPVDLNERCPRFIGEFTSQVKTESKRSARPRYEVKQEGMADHFLDAFKYAMACLHIPESGYAEMTPEMFAMLAAGEEELLQFNQSSPDAPRGTEVKPEQGGGPVDITDMDEMVMRGGGRRGRGGSDIGGGLPG